MKRAVEEAVLYSLKEGSLCPSVCPRQPDFHFFNALIVLLECGQLSCRLAKVLILE